MAMMKETLKLTGTQSLQISVQIPPIKANDVNPKT